MLVYWHVHISIGISTLLRKKSDNIYKYNAFHRSYLFNIVDCYISFDIGVIKLIILDFHKSAIKERGLFAPYHDRHLIMSAMLLNRFFGIPSLVRNIALTGKFHWHRTHFQAWFQCILGRTKRRIGHILIVGREGRGRGNGKNLLLDVWINAANMESADTGRIAGSIPRQKARWQSISIGVIICIGIP